ncbi:MAG: acetyl-CoA carboxylase carboxyltransferase subunit alpha [Rhodospirillaceae bacterium]|nr:acetyl-CoA carboxylase carboxyltransferase subunit alpha [Rhodospirillaceae bacterium]
MHHAFLEFEKPIAELESQLEELRRLSDQGALEISDDVARLETKVVKLLRTTYDRLTPLQKVQVARHPDRPHFVDYLQRLVDGFVAISGDRTFGDDPAILGGMGRFRGRAVMVIGQEKGADTESRVFHNFGMARPEGYRKAQRLMRLAHQFGMPVLTFVDTAGAYPGIASEERGQAEAIARSIETCLEIEVPIITTVIGEGGSGGAIAIAVADRVLMLEHAIYSVISPEGCASILWRSADQAGDAAQALRLTANDLKHVKVIDDIIKEPIGGAHRNPDEMIAAVGDHIATALTDLSNIDGASLRARRRQRFLNMGTDVGPIGR